MNQLLLICIVAFIIVPATFGGETVQDATAQVRRLASAGPCAGFGKPGLVCPGTPDINFDATSKNKNDLSSFAQNWIDYTCCQIVTEPLHGIIASVWFWLQVCTKTMARATTESYELDAKFEKSSIAEYAGGPLHNMKAYCPQDLDGGELNEWVVTTFFPVMEEFNPNFKAYESTIKQCEKSKHSGAVTLLFREPQQQGAFGHISLILHDDKTLELPPHYDDTHYVSFNHHGNTIGAMITGTKADYVQFGIDLKDVSEVVTLHNADTINMLARWKQIKESGQMFDLMEWNCGRVALEVLQAGFPDCSAPLELLWTPKRTLEYVQQMQTKINDAESPSKRTSLQKVHDKQIVTPVVTETKETGLTVIVVVVAALVSFLGTLILAAIVAGVIIFKMKADASRQLESGLANLLISAAATAKKDNIVVGEKVGDGPPSKNKPKKKNAIAPTMGDTISSQMDKGDVDGETDFNEFSKWAKEHKLTSKQSKLLWRDLDQNKDAHVSKKEWDTFIDKRPNLKWLCSRLQSVRRS